MNINSQQFFHSAIALGVLVASFHSATSFAGGGIGSFLPAFNSTDSGLYMGLSGGQSSLEPRVTVSGGVVDSDSDTAYKVFAGYDFNKNIALEAFYADLGAAHIDIGTAKSDVDYKVYGAGVVYTQPVSEKLSAIAKVGYAKVDNTVEPGVTIKQIKNHVIYGGLGAEYDLTENLFARVEYEYFDKDMNLISAGLSWKF